MANSTIIPIQYLREELPDDAVNSRGEMTDAIYQATAFVNTYARNYWPFDEFNSSASPQVPRAPYEIVSICKQVAKLYYYQNIGERYRDGNEGEVIGDQFDRYKDELRSIRIEPTWEEQTVSLDSNNAMVVGDRNAGGMWPQVIPQTVQVISGSTNVWVSPDDWTVTMGGRYDNEYPDAWYLYAESSSVEGTMRFMRTYRNDRGDYARYGQ